MRQIEEVLSVVAPDNCGHGHFVDDKKKPVCPVGHALAYYGEFLPKLFKRRSEVRITQCAKLLGVEAEPLGEFIAAWDQLRTAGMEPRLAFDRALTAAEKVEDRLEAQREAAALFRAEHPGTPYVDVTSKFILAEDTNVHRDAISAEFDGKSKWAAQKWQPE